jgi:eukaryotic-like serine/threonine-protein kinase
VTAEALFQEALSKSPEERAAFLERAFAERPELRAAVEALFAAHDNTNPYPGNSTSEQADSGPAEGATTDFRPPAAAGVTIAGRYTLVEKIGEGGMGEVWVAKQSTPVKRNVAVKFIKPGMDSKSVLARFEAERQALAMMDHPNIAKVLDGGLTATGRPFFVMELVKGVPITQYCDAVRLTPRQRLELFVPVCVRPFSTPTRKGSFTATSSHPMFSSRCTTINRCPR